MRIIVFGAGHFYHEKKSYIAEEDEIIALFDNDAGLWGTQTDGITIYNPEDLFSFSYDKIILMSIYALDMKKQLLELGCDPGKIVRYIEYLKDIQSRKDLEKIALSCCKKEGAKRSCLIISTVLDYNGGSMAAVYAAMALRQKDYEVVIAAPEGSDAFIEDVKKQGINIIIYTNLAHASEEDLFWINHFQFVIVNPLQMTCCAIAAANRRKVWLWLHESKEVYECMNYWEEDVREGIQLKSLNICAVSPIAKRNFLDRYFAGSIKLLPYGIPDERADYTIRRDRPLTFAVIGPIQPGKGQDILLDAIGMVEPGGDIPVFKLIGKCLDNPYGCMIKERVRKYSSVHMLGEMTHKEIMESNKDIDVFIISSREETMSMVATEAMMLERTCIISDSSGMADYINEYVNGMVFSTEKSEALAEKIMWCMNHRDKLKEMGMRARETYETYFSMDAFGERLEIMLNS